MVQLIGRLALLVGIVLCVLAFFAAPKSVDVYQLLAVAGVLGFGAVLLAST